MITMPKVTLADETSSINNQTLIELDIGELIKVARVKKSLYEKQLTTFLNYTICRETALNLTVQERYYILLQYLQSQVGTELELPGVHIPDYFKNNKDLVWTRSVKVDGHIFRQLTGADVELMETVCEDLADWLMCAMALQKVENVDIETLDNQGREDYLRVKVKEIAELKQDEFIQLFNVFSAANNQLAFYLETSFDQQGITVLRGADDAPCRFCVDSTFSEIVNRLAASFHEHSPEDDDRLPTAGAE